jgi:hypothetical protein
MVCRDGSLVSRSKARQLRPRVGTTSTGPPHGLDEACVHAL